MVNTIFHPGIIEAIDGSHVFVRIVQTSACTACGVKGLCTVVDSKEKVIEVVTSGQFTVGDKVEVYAETSMGMRAVLLAFVIPFFIFVISLFAIMFVSGGNELISALSSLCSLAGYYLLLSKNKTKLGRKFLFKIKTLNN